MPGCVNISKPPSPPPIPPLAPKLKPMSETTVTPYSPPPVPKPHEIVRADSALSVSHLPEEVRPDSPPVPRLSERVQPFSPTSVPQTLSELLLPGPAIRPPGSMLPPLWSASDLRALVEEGYEPSVVGWALDHARGNRMNALEWLEENAVFQPEFTFVSLFDSPFLDKAVLSKAPAVNTGFEAEMDSEGGQ